MQWFNVSWWVEAVMEHSTPGVSRQGARYSLAARASGAAMVKCQPRPSLTMGLPQPVQWLRTTGPSYQARRLSR